MKVRDTTALRKILGLKQRLKVIQGGSSAGKTIGIELRMINRLQKEKGLLSSVVSETVPHLKRGAIRDFLSLMESQGYYKDSLWNRSDFIYTFETGSKLEFFSADQPDKVRGPRRNGDLFMNECNNMTYDTYTQLAIRTEGDIYLDYNPVAEFWVQDEIIKRGIPHDFIILTYLDNEGLPKVIVDEIESRKGNKQFWKVYGEGQLGEIEGRIYTGWQIIDEIPHEARLERYGLDFGYTNDPTAIVAIYYYNGGYILDEVLFAKGMSNRQIAETLLNQKKALVVADSAEPKSIDEIKGYQLNIIGADKGKNSVRQGIQIIQDQQISVTKRSVNVIKAYRNYLWITDKDGRILNEPDHFWSDACFPAGTIVNGKNIEDVGLCTGFRDLYSYEIGGEQVVATSNHPVMTQRGLVELDALRYNDVIWRKKSLFTQVSGGQDIRTVLRGLIGVTSAVARRIVEAKNRDYIDLYGKKKTELSQTDSIFIILTTIPSIILWTIYSLLTALNTIVFIGLKKSVNGLGKISRTLLRKHQNGQRQPRVGRGDEKWGWLTTIIYWIKSQSLRIAIYVEKSSRLSGTGKIDGVISTVVKKHYVGQGLVYNLRTKSGLYLADGLLVSNCDAIRYGMNSLIPVIQRKELMANMPRYAPKEKQNPAR